MTNRYGGKPLGIDVANKNKTLLPAHHAYPLYTLDPGYDLSSSHCRIMISILRISRVAIPASVARIEASLLMHRLHNLALYFYNLLGIPYSKLLRMHRRSADTCFDLVILFLQPLWLAQASLRS